MCVATKRILAASLVSFEETLWPLMLLMYKYSFFFFFLCHTPFLSPINTFRATQVSFDHNTQRCIYQHANLSMQACLKIHRYWKKPHKTEPHTRAILRDRNNQWEERWWMCPESKAHHPEPTEESSSLPSSAVLPNYNTPNLKDTTLYESLSSQNRLIPCILIVT